MKIRLYIYKKINRDTVKFCTVGNINKTINVQLSLIKNFKAKYNKKNENCNFLSIKLQI